MRNDKYRMMNNTFHVTIYQNAKSKFPANHGCLEFCVLFERTFTSALLQSSWTYFSEKAYIVTNDKKPFCKG